MAGKEATVFVVDVGQSMGLTQQDRQTTDLDLALEYVWDKIATIVRSSHRQERDIQLK